MKKSALLLSIVLVAGTAMAQDAKPSASPSPGVSPKAAAKPPTELDARKAALDAELARRKAASEAKPKPEGTKTTAPKASPSPTPSPKN